MEYSNQTKNRIKRVGGQLKGITRMMEESKEISEVIIQLIAVRSAVNRTIGVVIGSNIIDYLNNSSGNANLTSDEILKQVVNLNNK